MHEYPDHAGEVPGSESTVEVFKVEHRVCVVQSPCYWLHVLIYMVSKLITSETAI